MEKFQAILSLLAPAITLALAVAGLFWIRHEKQRSAANGEAEAASKALFLQRAEAWLLGALPALITKVENEWLCPESGRLKQSAVKAELLKIAPPELIAAIGESSLDCMIEKALDEVRGLWDELPGVLISNQIAVHNAEAEDDDTGTVECTITVGTPSEDETTVPAAVIEELRERGLHLELADDGRITAMPNDPTELNGPSNEGTQESPAEDENSVSSE